MAWNRIQAARLLNQREMALFEHSLPEHATQLGEKELRSRIDRLRAQRDRFQADPAASRKAQMFAEAVQRLENEAKKKKSTDVQHSAPTVGKTGGLGAKAERPSEGSDRRQSEAPPVESGRRTKAPAETPHSRGSHGMSRRAARSGPSAAARPVR